MIPAWIGVFYVLLKTNADPDLWGHLRFGLDALAAHGLTTIDPYSYTSDIPWLNHEWLSEVVIAAAYQAFGSAGLVATKMTFIIATFALLAPVLRRAPELWRWPSTLLTVLGVTPIALTVRPQLWTMLFVVVLCHALNAAPSRRWFLPFAFAVWANVHGGWIVGVGVLWLWSTVEGVTGAKERPSLWITLGVPAACTLATLVNPYGVRLWIFIAETVRLSRANIIEWQPVWRDSIWMALLWLLAVGWTALAIRQASVRRPQALAVIAVFAFASLRVNRLLPLFILMCVILLLPYVQQPLEPVRSWPRGRLLVDAALICNGVLLLAWPGSPGCIRMQGDWLPDADAARALAAARPAGRMATWFDWGEYAIWHFGPGVKVSVDGRRETVYSDEQLGRQVAMTFGEPGGLQELERSVPDYVWLPVARSARTRSWLTAHNYRIDIQTPRSFVAVRADLPRVETVPAVSTPCFPGP